MDLPNCNNDPVKILLEIGSVETAVLSKESDGHQRTTHRIPHGRHAHELSRLYGAHGRERHEPRTRRHCQPRPSPHRRSPRGGVSPRAAHQRNGNRHRRAGHPIASSGLAPGRGIAPDCRRFKAEQRPGAHRRPGRKPGRRSRFPSANARRANSGGTCPDGFCGTHDGQPEPRRAHFPQR